MSQSNNLTTTLPHLDLPNVDEGVLPTEPKATPTARPSDKDQG